MKRTLLAAAGIIGLSALAGCSVSTTSTDEAASAPNEAKNSGASPAPPSATGAGSAAEGDPAADGASESSPGQPAQAGQLTAGVWDDNLNYDFFNLYLETSTSMGLAPLFGQAERDAAHTAAGQPKAARQELDLALVFDTTGSMGDELSYVQTEFVSIVQAIHEKFPSTVPHFALVLYRDQGDAYVTRTFDFTTDAVDFRTKLAAQSAGGGGDYEEGVPEGLQDTEQLSWRQGDVARLAFWVADAPAHDAVSGQVKTAIQGIADKGVHMYPVAASGADDRTELTMRSAAQITGGRYLFLTDDSGIGESHAKPHIPCYAITRFDHAIVRMVESEMTGTHVMPAADDILRKVGDPVDGKCTTDDQTVTMY